MKGRNWIHFNATVYEAEQLLNTKYHYYQHDISKGVRMGCEKYYLPKGVREHVDFVVCPHSLHHHMYPGTNMEPLNQMPTIQLEGIRPLPNKVARGVAKSPHGGLTGLANCYESITIECIRALYQFGPGNTSACFDSSPINCPSFPLTPHQKVHPVMKSAFMNGPTTFNPRTLHSSSSTSQHSRFRIPLTQNSSP